MPTHPQRFSITKTPSAEDMKVVWGGVEDHNKQYTYGDLDIPAPDISLVLKDPNGAIIGGVITSMKAKVMHLEVLWIDKPHRRQGHASTLLLAAERLAKEDGYTASQPWTFSFQGPEFYQSIGYKILGIFDGYTDNIIEYVLMKKLTTPTQTPPEPSKPPIDGYTIIEDNSEESMKILHGGLHQHVTEHVGELRKNNPEIQINLVIKDNANQVIGGIQAGTTLKTMYIEHLWTHEHHRKQGYGKKLLLAAEAIARENGCISGQASVLSFQAPGFFHKLGYETFGISDGYPDPIKEYFLIKKF